eukprot:TRINITY_DN2686_c0_g1_i1.p1 TRINITY_DN2686_c0_g1~~TRINITY_DN2686_c0_g1_i1.p1  ORF type:complete len:118 (+),score=20.89 TRINITY_DN2686_c0_g1_i1:112-465(+)
MLRSLVGSEMCIRDRVHTEYHSAPRWFGISQAAILSSQYSATAQYSNKRVNEPPAVSFNYDVSPIMHTITEQPSSFLHFVVRTCAIVGGVFAVCGLVDSLLYHGGLTSSRELGLLMK